MTDLTGAKLALAVARVVGKRNPKLWEQTCGEMTCVRTDECSGLHYEWRPDLGGAAAWEVLEWLRRPDSAYWVSFEPSPSYPAHCVITYGDCLETYGHGPTDAIALCRAVVALGEAG